MRRRTVIFLCLVGLLIVGAAITVQAAVATSNATPAGHAAPGSGTVIPTGIRVTLPPTTSATNPPLIGAQAISPRTQPVTTTTPTFTAQDASDYALAHLPSQLQGGSVSVKNVVFVNNSVALTQMQTGIAGIPDRLLCVVQVGGKFVVSAPGYQRTATLANMLFDGQTGNYLGLTIPYQ
jgi:hypothetical protein